MDFLDSMWERSASLTWRAPSGAWVLKSYVSCCWRRTWRFGGEKTVRWVEPVRSVTVQLSHCSTVQLSFFSPPTWLDAAGGGGATLLRCSSSDQSPEERRATESGSTSSGPRQNVLCSAERWLWVTPCYGRVRRQLDSVYIYKRSHNDARLSPRFICSCGGGWAPECHECLHIRSQHLRELLYVGLHHPPGTGKNWYTLPKVFEIIAF